ncbi:MAG: TatD family hydrolase [Verrucomicrobiota bacterium]
MQFTDTHCHLDFPDYEADLSLVIERSQKAGVARMISIGTTLASSAAALQLAQTHSPVYATVGIHPCHADEFTLDQLSELKPHFQNPRLVGLGECGLDYHHLPEKQEEESEAEYQERLEKWKMHQKSIFRAQLDLAAEENLNVVIHQRSSWDDTFEILAPYADRLKAVYHCFGETPERMWQIIDLGFYVSFTGIATFKNADLVRQSLRAVPDDRYLIETDAPYLAPVPHRGKRNEPAYIPEIAKVVAETRNISLEAVSEQTETNTQTFFQFERTQ